MVRICYEIEFLSLPNFIACCRFVDRNEIGECTRKKAASSRLRQHHSSASAHNDILAMPHPVVMTQSRIVRSSLQRLEKEQDEMFEL